MTNLNLNIVILKQQFQEDQVMSEALPQCYHVFYTKDINKKKKVFKEGVLIVTANNGKLYDEDGLLVTGFKNKEKVEIDEEYVVNNSYLITVDKIGNFDDFGTGAIFTQKQITILPIKKKVMPGLSKKVPNQEDLVNLKSGLNIETKLFQILRPHQREGVEFMYECVSGKKSPALSGCILADYMGLGKTLQTLALTYSMIKQKDMKKFVIVCPLTLLDVWQKETKKWLQQKILPLVCHGDGTETSNTVKKFTTYQYRMLIISYETFYKNIEKISGKCDMIIFDQGHRMKNKKSKLLLKLKTFKCERRILLTGTPIQNNLQQLYTCISIINPRMFGNEALFKNVFMKPILQGLSKKATPQQKELAKERTAQLARQLKQFSLRRSADVLKKFLPTKYEHFIFLKLTPLQNSWYERIVDPKNESDKDMFRMLNELRKLFIHPSILKMSKINKGDCNFVGDCSQELSYKIQFTLSVVDYCVENNQKCVIVSYYTQTLDFIADLLRQRKIGYAKLDGRQRPEQRRNSILKFQKQIPVLLLSGKAGGTGLTLICAVKMVMIEPDWNPSNDSQVMGRIWRQGQQKQVHIFRLITASTFEEKILQRQTLKKTLSNNLIDNGDEYDSGVDYENLGKLFVQSKGQVLTYHQKQNDLDQFLTKHKPMFKSNSGIIFVKTNNSNSEAENKQNVEQSSIQNNEFCSLGLCNFQEKGQSQTQSGEDQMDEQEDKIQEIQKIKIKPKKTDADNSQKYKQKKMEEKPQKNEIETDYEEQAKISQKIDNKVDIKKMETSKKIEQQEQSREIILKGENNKTYTNSVGPNKLLSKIIKK